MHTLVIADDEANQREGMCSYIDWEALGFTVTASFSDGAELIGHISGHPTDVILTDIRMLHVSGLEVAEYVRAHCPDTVVVLVSGYKEFAYAQKAVELGVRRYVVKPVSLDEIRGIFAALCLELDEKKAQAGGESNHKVSAEQEDVIINKALKYIQTNYMSDISLNEVADHVYLSPVYFSRFFKQKTNENYIDYLIAFRMRQAIELLRTGKWKIYEIGIKVGYPNTKYFTRVFKGFTGYSPKDYLRYKLAGSE